MILVALPLHLAYLAASRIIENKVPIASFFETLEAMALMLAAVSSILHVAVEVKPVVVSACPFTPSPPKAQTFFSRNCSLRFKPSSLMTTDYALCFITPASDDCTGFPNEGSESGVNG
jgi:hypothetical protein